MNKHILEEVNRIKELSGIPVISEQPSALKTAFKGMGDDAVRTFRAAANATDDVVKSARNGSSTARRALVSSPNAMIGNIAITYGDDTAREFVKIMEKISKNPKKYPNYFKNGKLNPHQGQRDAVLRKAMEKTGASGGKTAVTGGKGLTQTVTKIKDVKRGSTEFIKTIEQNVINNTNITNVYVNKNFTFIVDDLVTQGVPRGVAQDTAMSIMVNRPIINVNNTVINKITKIDDFVMGNKNNINIVNIEKNTIKNIKTPKPGAGKPKPGNAGRNKGAINGLSDDIVSEYRRLLDEWKKLNPGKRAGQGTRERFIREAILIVERNSGQAVKTGMSWKNWLVVGGAAGLTGLGLWSLLSDDEEIAPDDMPLADEVDDSLIPPVYDEDDELVGDETGSSEADMQEYNLGERTLRDEEAPSGGDVKDLQDRLNKLFGFGLALSGNYDDETVSKVKEFQRRANISVDGDFGPISYQSLLDMESGTSNDETGSSQATAPEDDLETMEPVIVTDIQNKKEEIADAGLSNVPENELIVVQAPENAPQNVTDKVIVRGAKQCPDGKTPVLVKSKEKEVNRKNKKKRKTVAVYRCRKV